MQTIIIPKCQQCQNDYDDLFHAPLKLQCSHSMCQNCVFIQFQNTSQNVCLQCKQIQWIYPRTIPMDQTIMESINRRKSQIEFLKKACQLLQLQKQSICDSVQQIYEVHSFLLQSCINLIQNYLITQNKKTIQEIHSLGQKTEQTITQLEFLQLYLDKNKNQAFIQNLDQGLVDTNTYNLLSNRAQLERESFGQLSKSLIFQFEELLKNFTSQRDQQISQQTNITQVQNAQELSRNSQSSIRMSQVQPQSPFQNLKELVSVKIDSQKLKVFSFQESKFDETIINTMKTDSYLTQIEQIGNQKIIISGGLYDQTKQRFTTVDNTDISEYNMQFGRYHHKTVFNFSQSVYLISGSYKGESIKKCEVFNLQKKQFQQISDIAIPVATFGAFFGDKSKVYACGGYKNAQEYQNKIQVYDCSTNQ